MKIKLMWTLIFVLLLAACGIQTDQTSSSPQPQQGKVDVEPSAESPTEAPTTATIIPDLLPEEEPPGRAASEFSTDFTKHSVPYEEILSGGPPKDGIPSIDSPNFTSTQSADNWLKPQEPVIALEVDNVARAYPIQILMWHEIVNDVVSEKPLIVSFCPLCNTAIVFEREFDGQVLDFGTTGRLRYSNLIMYDRQTETWWQQATGEAIAGEYTGSQLRFYPAVLISWTEFKSAYPEGEVLSRDTGYPNKAYGQNPYAGYDDVNRSPFLYDGPETSDALPPMARVVTVEVNGHAVAYPYAVLEELHVINDQVGGRKIAVFWSAGTSSALDSSVVAEGRDVGTAVVYDRQVDGEILDFQFEDDKIIDIQTGSVWNVLGQAVRGPQVETQLKSVVSINHFWFSWAAFKPETRVYQP